MIRFLISIIVLTILSVITPLGGDLYGQNFGGNNSFNDVYNRNKDFDERNLKATDPNTTTDTLSKKKQAKPKKPLESFFFSDSLKKNNVFAWKFNHALNDIKVIEVDTALNNFQKDYLFMREETVGSAYLGQLGGGSIPIDYFNRNTANVPFAFLNPMYQYIFTPDNIPFYNGKRPFSQLSYFMSGQMQKLEQQLRVTHAQNISPSSGINLTYRNNATKGIYANQRSTEKNLSLAFSHTGKRYSIHGGYIYNMGDIRENGGVKLDSDITDTIIDLPENIEMQLKDARTRFKGNTFYYTQSYAIPFSSFDEESKETAADKTSFYLGQSFKFSQFNKVYTDTKEQSGDFYNHWYTNQTTTRDSISERRMDISAFAQFQPYSRNGIIGLITGGAGYLAEKFYYFSPDQYISPYSGTSKSSFYVYGGLGGAFSKYLKWGADMNYTLAGYRSGDVKLNANLSLSAYIKGRPMSIDFDFLIRNETPSFWSEQYHSNHYVWNNSFNKETETRFGAKILIPYYGIELGATQSIVKNKVYYNALSLPSQEGEAVSISGIYLQKDFRAGGFHFNHRAKLQWSSKQEVVPVPLAAANLTYYFEFNVVKNVLRMQLGFDGYYTTKYYGYGYNPAISQFYNQRQVEIGNYPMLDAFVTGKWKRVRFLVKFQHLNYNMFGGRNYFDIAHYPLNRRMLKFGVSWNFYD